jgi:hypothetical protein
MFILKEFFFPSHSRGGLIRRHHPFQVESAHRPVMVFGEFARIHCKRAHFEWIGVYF